MKTTPKVSLEVVLRQIVSTQAALVEQQRRSEEKIAELTRLLQGAQAKVATAKPVLPSTGDIIAELEKEAANPLPVAAPAKRGRGRPRKNPVAEANIPVLPFVSGQNAPMSKPAKVEKAKPVVVAASNHDLYVATRDQVSQMLAGWKFAGIFKTARTRESALKRVTTAVHYNNVDGQYPNVREFVLRLQRIVEQGTVKYKDLLQNSQGDLLPVRDLYAKVMGQ